eukprot:136032-Alexandrium_andersonii.AAC.1
MGLPGGLRGSEVALETSRTSPGLSGALRRALQSYPRRFPDVSGALRRLCRAPGLAVRTSPGLSGALRFSVG